MASEKRIDAEDGLAYTYEELAAFYKGKYKKSAIAAYWEECRPAKTRGKAKEKGKAKAKEKVKAKAKPKAKVLSRTPATPEAVLEKLKACKVVPVIKLDDAAHAAPLARALLEGGIDVAEITFRTACAADAMKEVTSGVPNVCVGAGTVLKPSQVDIAIEAGADFIVSPGLDPAVARRCKQCRVLYLPGVVTPTEVMMATSKFGLNKLKFFPASNYGGAATLKSFSAVFQDIEFMPTGGITETNIKDIVSLPNVFAAGGSWMVADAAVKSAALSGNWSAITDASRKACQAVGQ